MAGRPGESFVCEKGMARHWLALVSPAIVSPPRMAVPQLLELPPAFATPQRIATLKTAVPASISGHGRTLVYYRDLLLVLLAKEFKVRYKSTFIGYAWSVMHPLVLAIIFFSLFGVILKLQVKAYALYLIAGLFPWQWIANTASSANFYFLGNSSLIKKVRFQRATLVLAGVLNESVHFLVSIPVILGFMLYYGRAPGIDWLWMLPALVLVQLAMTFGLGLLVATSNLFFRDLERLIALATQLLFYATPIVYPAEKVPAEYQWLFFANPFAGIVMCWQGLFYQGGVPPLYFGVALAWSFVWVALGWLVYRRQVWRFAEIV
jgi:lipopolysaccharide transport system permease protein